MSGWQLFLIDIYCVTKRLKRIEADADRQNDIHRYPVQMTTHHEEQGSKIVHKEIIILEHAKDAEIQYYINGTHHLLPSSLSAIKFK